MNKITTESEVSDRFLADILITAVEGGIGYWALTRKYAYSDLNPRTTKVQVIEYDEELDTQEPPVWVDLDTILSAIQRIVNSIPEERLINQRGRSDIMQAVAANDAGNIDSELADSIMQVAVLGEIRYG